MALGCRVIDVDRELWACVVCGNYERRGWNIHDGCVGYWIKLGGTLDVLGQMIWLAQDQRARVTGLKLVRGLEALLNGCG